MSNFVIKMIALVTMVIDHTGVLFADKADMLYLRMIGRISFPLFAFLIGEGCRHTRDSKKYLFRLLGFALMIEGAFEGIKLYMRLYAGSGFGFENKNIFFTLFLGASACFGYEWIAARVSGIWERRVLGLAPFALCMLAAHWFRADYGAIGVFMIFMPYLFQKKQWKALMILCGVLALYGIYFSPVYFRALLDGGAPVFLFPIFGMLPLIPVLLYNGKKGYGLNKWFFYIAYPVHFIILFLIHELV